MSLDGLPPAHLQVLLDGLPVFERYGLLLAGGYAFRAHEILHRPSQDLDFATRDHKEALEPRWVTVRVTPAASVRAVSLEDTVGLKAPVAYLEQLSGRMDEFARLETLQHEVQAGIRQFRASDRMSRDEVHDRAVP